VPEREVTNIYAHRKIVIALWDDGANAQASWSKIRLCLTGGMKLMCGGVNKFHKQSCTVQRIVHRQPCMAEKGSKP